MLNKTKQKNYNPRNFPEIERRKQKYKSGKIYKGRSTSNHILVGILAFKTNRNNLSRPGWEKRSNNLEK